MPEKIIPRATVKPNLSLLLLGLLLWSIAIFLIDSLVAGILFLLSHLFLMWSFSFGKIAVWR